MILLADNIYIPDEIAALEAALLNSEDISPWDRASILEDKYEYERIWDLWQEFGDVPMDPETECIESEWHEFPAGTNREEIWHWFEEHFGLSVARNLMGQGCRFQP